MSIQERAAALWKYGRLYPRIFPGAVEWASELYRQDRIDRGVELEADRRDAV